MAGKPYRRSPSIKRKPIYYHNQVKENPMKNLIMSLALLAGPFSAMAADMSKGADNFYKSDKVTAQKVAFKNQYNMTVAGNLFIPQNLNQGAKNPAIVVGHPMGAVKEQSANLYAQKLADQGFITLSLDCLSGERARGSLATRCCRMFMPRLSVLRWISLAPDRLSTGLGLVLLGFAAVRALSSARPRSTRE
jgi:hypothetical protein